MLTTTRRALRRIVPAAARLMVVQWRRRVCDCIHGYRFAMNPGEYVGMPELLASYSLPVADYPGQEPLAAAKRRNLALMAEALDGVVINAGEVFSLWRLAGRPSATRGYLPAAAIRSGRFGVEVGGATCLLATVVYNAALLGALEVFERRCHSVDTYGERRYFELGRDAAIEYAYLDLRFRNPHPFPLLLRVAAGEDAVRASLWADSPPGIQVELFVSAPVPAPGGFAVRTRRVITGANGCSVDEVLPQSFYRTIGPPPGDSPRPPRYRRLIDAAPR